MKELSSVLKNIKNKELQPFYFFHGEEPYFIDVAVKAFENEVLTEDEKAFNQTVVYGKDTSYGDILSLARQYPMMGDLQVIIVKEAQDLNGTSDDFKALKLYAENPVPSTLLVIAHKHKKIDARKATFLSVLSKKNAVFTSTKMRDYEVAAWISKRITSLQLSATPAIAPLLGQYLGTDLSRIDNELQKLKLILKPGEQLDEKVVETHIGISKDFNVFELINALSTRNAAAAFKIAHYIGKSPKNNPFVMMMTNIYNFFSNLIIFHTMPGSSKDELAAAMSVNPYFVKDYAAAARLFNLKHCTRVISVLREMDLKSKGLGAVNMTEPELLKELVYKIINVHQYKVKT